MLENIPTISVSAVEVSKTKIKVPTPEELYQALSQLKRSNPWLLKFLISGIYSAIDVFQDQSKYLPEGAINTPKHHLFWRSLLILDLIDRALFDEKMQEKWNQGVAIARPPDS